MSTKIKIQNPVTIKLKGVDYTLLFDMEAVERAETVTGKSLLTGIHKQDLSAPTISFVKAMFYSALLPLQPDMTYAEVSALVTKKSIFDVWLKVVETWNNSNPDVEPEEENPIQDQS
jgi:hypothetical protein